MPTKLAQMIKAPPIRQGTRYLAGDELSIADIRMDGGTQARAGLDEETITNYALAMQAGAQFPLIVVFHDGANHWLADGFHRVKAAERIGRAAMRADVQSGTQRDAILYAMGANDTHGLPRRRDDLHRSIARMLADEEWKTWSDRRIAEQVHCDHKTVAAARARLSGEVPQIAAESRTVERGGTTYQQKAKRPAPARPPAPEPPAPATITVTTDKGTHAIVPTRRIGDLATHPSVTHPHAPDVAWSITYVPLGSRVGPGFPDQQTAESALRDLATLDWGDMKDGVIPPALAAQARKILARHRGTTAIAPAPVPPASMAPTPAPPTGARDTLLVRPTRPPRDDVSVVLAYLEELEAYVDALEAALRLAD